MEETTGRSRSCLQAGAFPLTQGATKPTDHGEGGLQTGVTVSLGLGKASPL